jgi:hypothetical protein
VGEAQELAVEGLVVHRNRPIESGKRGLGRARRYDSGLQRKLRTRSAKQPSHGFHWEGV